MIRELCADSGTSMAATSMKIELKKVAKRYRMEWILRDVNLVLESGQKYAVTGPNGSGKSTLLKILSGHLSPSKGQRVFNHMGKNLDLDHVYQHLGYAAPYVDIIEAFTLKEALVFHQRFKPFLRGMEPRHVIDLLGFKQSSNKYIRNFSSGMKQRLKLVLAICSNTAILLLDEPTTNLDQQGTYWYQKLIEDFAENRLVVIASNVETDLRYCKSRINILDFK